MIICRISFRSNELRWREGLPRIRDWMANAEEIGEGVFYSTSWVREEPSRKRLLSHANKAYMSI